MNRDYHFYTEFNKIIRDNGNFLPISTRKKFLKSENRTVCYVNNIMTYDTETTTLYHYNDEWIIFDHEKSIENGGYIDYIHCEKHTIVYLWTFTLWCGFCQFTFYGRTNQQFYEFLKMLTNQIDRQERIACNYIIYVHNLAFDFVNSLENIYTFDKVFARKPHKPIYADTGNITFKCSYFLTNSSLENLTRDNKIFQKLTGTIDYLQLRLPHTIIEKKIIDYATYDTMSLAESLSIELEFYKYIDKIPLTSTGKLRRLVKEKLHGKACAQRDKRNVPSVELYQLALILFQGGDTHANAEYSNIVHTIDELDGFKLGGFDIGSSYPYAELSEKYPDSQFIETNVKEFEYYMTHPDYVLFMEIDFSDICVNYPIPFIKASKTLDFDKAKYDNGRIWKAKYVSLLITDIDYEIIKRTYKWKSEHIKKMWVAHASYLTDAERDIILDLYVEKTTLKGVAGREEDYKRSKNYINSDFGRNVTKPIETSVEYDCGTGTYQEIAPTIDEVAQKLDDMRKKEQFTNYFRGIWITAYARRNLYRLIDCFTINVESYHIYNDTDSAKGFINEEILKRVEKLNIEVVQKLREILTPEQFEKSHPKDMYGNEHQIGIYDFEGYYNTFITYGSKKYAYEDENGLHLTVSGLKKSASKSLNSIKDFKLGTKFNTKISGRQIAEYQENQPTLEIEGHTYDDKHSLSLTPTTYTLSQTQEYFELVDFRQHS